MNKEEEKWETWNGGGEGKELVSKKKMKTQNGPMGIKSRRRRRSSVGKWETRHERKWEEVGKTISKEGRKGGRRKNE